MADPHQNLPLGGLVHVHLAQGEMLGSRNAASGDVAEWSKALPC
jgi:hypothetical protein